ncbi:hypothetical protein N7501_004913 [Penicillium viridicatum]|nr:hypothetical protein N7501_004913 [Penicillium viridicatum]
MSSFRDKAVEAFKHRLPVFYQQCKPLVDPLISLLAERIYLDIGNTDLPRWRDKEDKQQAELRSKIVGHTMNELRQTHKEEVQFDDDRENDIFTIVLYWYLKDSSAKFLRERQRARHNVWSTALFWGLERRSTRSIAHTNERALEYCSPLAPVFIKREPFFAPNSFYGERDVSKEPYLKIMLKYANSSQSRQLPRRSIARIQDGRKIIEVTDPEALPEGAVSESLLRELESDDLLP